MSICFFASDLHGKIERYKMLFERIQEEKPHAVFLGGACAAGHPMAPGLPTVDRYQFQTPQADQSGR